MNTSAANSSFPLRRHRQQLSGGLMFLVGLLVIVGETPWLSRNVPPALIAALPALVLCGYFWQRLPLSRAFPKTLMAVLSYVFLTLSYKFLGISTVELGYFFAGYKFLFVMLAMAAVAPALSPKQRVWLCVLAAGGLVVNMVDNVRLWMLLGRRYILFFQGEGRTSNVADTSFATAVMLEMGAVFLLALHARRRWLKRISWALVLFSAYFLVAVLQRGITFFLGMALLLLLGLPDSVFRLERPRALLGPLFLLLVLAVLLFGGGAEVVLSGLGSLLENQPRIYSRINHLLLFLQTNSLSLTGGSLAGRINLTLSSIDTFLQSGTSILVGVGFHHRASAFELSAGNHSLFFDTLARYGLLGGCIFIWVLRRISATVFDVSGLPPRHPLRARLMVFYAMFVLRAFVGNPFTASVATQLLVTAPLLVSLLADAGRERSPDPQGLARNALDALHERSGTC